MCGAARRMRNRTVKRPDDLLVAGAQNTFSTEYFGQGELPTTFKLGSYSSPVAAKVLSVSASLIASVSGL